MANELDLLMVLDARDQASGVIQQLAQTVDMLGISFSQMARQAGLAGSILGGVGSAGQRVGVGLTLAGAALTGIGLGAGEAVRSLIDSATEYDSAITAIQNNTNMSAADTQRMHDVILQLAEDTGAPLDQLEQGFMHAMNVTQNASAAMDILRIATESAVSTGGDAGMTANILANAMHEYGLDVSTAATAQERQNEIVANATKVMGQLHLAAAESNATLEQFAESSSRAIAVAANYHVPFDQVLAALVGLSKHGFPDMSQAAIQVQDVMLHMANPTKQAKQELERLTQLTGVDLVGDFSAAGLASKGLQGVLEDLHTAFTKMGLSEAEASAEAQRLINAQRGGIGLSVLLGTAWQDLHKTLADLNNEQLVNTVTDESMNRTKATLANQMARLHETLQVTAITIGEALTPAMLQLLAQLQPVITSVTNWLKANPQLAGTILEVVAVVGTLLGVLMTLAGVAMVLGVALSPIGLALMGITAAVALLGTAWTTNFGGIRTVTGSVVGFLQVSFAQLQVAVQIAWTVIQMTVQRVLGWLQPTVQRTIATVTSWWSQHHTQIMQVTQQVWQFIQTLIQGILNTVVPFVQTEIDQVTTWWDDHHTQIQEATQRVWNAIQTVISFLLGRIVSEVRVDLAQIMMIVTVGWAVVQAVSTVAWQAIQILLATAWDIIRKIVTLGLIDLEHIIMIGVDIINGDWKEAWTEAENLLSDTWEGMKRITKAALDGIISFIDYFIDKWNGLHLTIPGFSVTIPSITVPGVGTIGGGTLSWGGFSESVTQLPRIPLLQAGGIVLGPTLALLGEAGPEAVVPLDQGGMGGTQIIIDLRGSQVMSDRDLDILIDKIGARLATWTVPAAGIRIRR